MFETYRITAVTAAAQAAYDAIMIADGNDTSSLIVNDTVDLKAEELNELQALGLEVE